MTQDCHKRNATYETWCQTCKNRDESKIELEREGGTDKRQADEEDEKQKKKGREKERQEVALFKYVGETDPVMNEGSSTRQLGEASTRTAICSNI